MKVAVNNISDSCQFLWILAHRESSVGFRRLFFICRLSLKVYLFDNTFHFHCSLQKTVRTVHPESVAHQYLDML